MKSKILSAVFVAFISVTSVAAITAPAQASFAWEDEE